MLKSHKINANFLTNLCHLGIAKVDMVGYNNVMGGDKTKLDLEQLRIEIRSLTNRKLLYRVLKEELTKIDHWKQQQRGDHRKAFQSRGKKR